MSANRTMVKMRWLSLAIVAVLLVPLLAACGPAAAPAPAAQPPAAATTAPAAPGAQAAPTAAAAAPAATTAPAAPAQAGGGKILRMSRIYEPATPLIPWQIDDNPTLFVSVNIYDSLLRVTKDGQSVEPALATKWEPASDGLSWTFTLRDGVKYSDGSPLKAEDVQASLLAAAKSEKSTWAANYKAIKDVQVVDPKTVKIILSEPFAALPSVLAMFCAGILPADLVKASEAKDFDVTTAWKTRGTGAFYSESWKKGDPIILKRNPNYWKGTPALDEVHIDYVPDDNTRILKLQGGETDVIDFVPLAQLDSVDQQPDVTAKPFTIAQMEFIMLNNTFKPLDDLKVRQALEYATDKEAINKAVFFNLSKPPIAPIPPGMYQATDLPGYPFDLEKAKQLMKESSAPNGFKLEMQVRSGNTAYANEATILKDQWSKIGVDVNIVNLETSVVRQNYREGKYQSMPTGWTNDMNDPTQVVNYAMRGGKPTYAYWTRYNNDDLNAKITAADIQQDPAKRAAQYHEIQKIYQEAAPVVWLGYTPATFAWRDNVQGFSVDPLSYYRFEDVTLK